MLAGSEVDMKFKFFVLKLSTLVFVIIYSSNLFSQYGSSGSVDSRSMGLAKTYNSTSTGIYSIGINPANLSRINEESFEFSSLFPLPFLSFHSGTDFLSMEQFNYYFGGVGGKARYLTEQDKKNFNDLFTDGGFIFSSISASLFSIAWKPSVDAGTFAFALNDFFGGNATIPQAIIELGLNGNQLGRKYNFNDEMIKSWWIRNYAISYSREFDNESDDWAKKIFAGISLKLVHGFYYAGLEESNMSLETGTYNQIQGQAAMTGYSSFSDNFGVKYDFDSSEHQSSFSLFMPPAGKGFGIDLGLSFLLEENMIASFAITDIGGISWTKNAAKFSSQGEVVIDDLTNETQLDSLKDKFIGKGEKVNSFSTGLPTALRFGFSYFFNEQENFIPGTLLLGVDYNQGFNDLPGNSKAPRFSIGFEWKPGDWIPYLRSGFSAGGAEGFGWALGLGMNSPIIEFNFATSNIQTILSPNSAEQISFAISSKWKF